MTHPLDGVSARLDRAKENIVQLERELVDFRREHPDLFKTQFNPPTGDIVYKVKQTPLEPRFSVLAGEALFLMRSSLDHLIAQLLIPITLAADMERVLENSYFPIYVNGDWKSFDWTKIPGVSPEIKTAISTCQPCNRTDGLPREDHALAVLNTLNNVDKHRVLLTLVNKTTVSNLKLGFSGSVHVREMRFSGGGVTGTSNVEAELMRGNVSFLTPNSGVNVESEATVEVAFKKVGTREGEPVIPTLEHLLEFVTKLIAEFRTRFF